MIRRLLPAVLLLLAAQRPTAWQSRVAEVQAARRAAGVPPLVVHPACQAVAERHLAKCLRAGGFEHVGMDGDFLDWQLTRAGLPSTPDSCIDLGATGTTQAAGVDRIDPRQYSNPRRTHHGELRNPRYRLLGFACGGGMSITILASGR